MRNLGILLEWETLAHATPISIISRKFANLIKIGFFNTYSGFYYLQNILKERNQ